MVTEVEGLEVEYGITLNKLTRQLAAAEARMTKTASDAERRFGRANTRISRGFRQTASSMTGVGGGLRNLSLQFSQVIQQTQTSGDFFRSLAVQAADLTVFMGPLGVALGAIGGGLATVAIDMLSTEDASDRVADSAKALTEALNDLSKSTTLVNLSTEELEERYANATDAARTFIAALREADEFAARGAVTSRLSAQAATLGAFDVPFDEPVFDFNETRRRIAIELADVREEISRTFDDTARAALLAQADALENQAGVLEDYRRSIEDLAKEYDISTDAAETLARAINATVSATGLDSQIAAAAELQTVMVDIFGSVERLPAPMLEFFRAAAQVGEEAAQIQGNIGETETTLQNLVAAGRTAVGVFSAIDGHSNSIKDGLFGAASAFNELLRARGAEVLAAGPDQAVNQVRERLLPSGIRRSDVVTQQFTLGANNRPGRGRGGRGGPAEPLLQNAEEVVAAIELQIELVGKSAAEVAELATRHELLAEAQRRGINLTDSLKAQIDAQAAAVGRATGELERLTAQMEFTASLEDEFLSGFLSDIASGESVIDGLAGAFSRLALQIAEAYFQSLLFNRGIFASGAGNGLLGGFLGPILGFADGGYTGPGGRNQVKGVVHAEEYVFDREATRRIGVQNLEALAAGRQANFDTASRQVVSAASAAPNVNVAGPEVNVRAIVVDDPSQREAAIFQSPRFEKEVLTIVNRRGR